MKPMTIVLFLLLVASGCAMSGVSAGNSGLGPVTTAQAPYYRAITTWQDRLDGAQFHRLDHALLRGLREKVLEKGWSNEMVATVLEETKTLTSFQMESSDHWDTPQEFVARNFQGDCEDIAIFMLATLKSLDYPYKARILAVKTMFVDHAMLKVEMPDRSWQVFETVKNVGPDTRLAYTPIVEFDDKQIIFSRQL